MCFRHGRISLFILLIAIHLSRGGCPDGYQVNSEKCYKFVAAGVQGFTAALQICENEEADLVSIESATENEFIVSLGGPALTGLLLTNQEWQWTDGTPLTFTNWEAGYPRQYFGDCAAIMQNGQWRNVDCENVKYAFICETKTTVDPNECPVDDVYYDSGNLSSPGYPANFAAGPTCHYDLAVPNGNLIEILFEEVMLGTKDHLDIYEGVNRDATLAILTNADNGSKKNITSTQHNIVIIDFVRETVTSAAESRWTAYFEPVPGVKPVTTVSPPNKCPKVTGFTTSGVLSSPGYPNIYSSGLNCSYLLIASADSVISIQFINLALAVGDYLTFYDTDINSPFSSFTGGQNPMTVVSRTGAVRALFYSAINSGEGSWSFSWTSTPSCPPKNYYGATEISSSGYPHQYGTRLKCYYNITAEVQRRVSVTFDRIETDVSYDLIMIYDGGFEKPRADAIFSGTANAGEKTFVSSGRNLLLVFTTAEIHQAGLAGWKARVFNIL